MSKRVETRVTEEGYTVTVRDDGGRVIYEYHATNNRYDSQGPVQNDGVPIETLKDWANDAAQQLAEEHKADYIGEV